MSLNKFAISPFTIPTNRNIAAMYYSLMERFNIGSCTTMISRGKVVIPPLGFPSFWLHFSDYLPLAHSNDSTSSGLYLAPGSVMKWKTDSPSSMDPRLPLN